MNDAAPTVWERLWYTRARDAVRGRFDASLDWRRVIAEAGLPPEAAALIRETIGATRLWKSERVAVAQELIAHFQDGMEAGRAMPVLVASFGESQQVARLIRRAKKRGRPLTWHVGRWCGVGLVALVAAYVLMGLYLLTGRPSIKVDYLALINAQAASVPEGERAWPLYRDALLAMGGKLTETDANGKLDAPTAFQITSESRPGDETWPQAMQFLEIHSAALKKLREAAARPELGLTVWTSPDAFAAEDRKLFGLPDVGPNTAAESEKLEYRFLASTLLPQVHLLRQTAEVVAADARRAALAGDADTAFANVYAMLGISRHCEEIPFLVTLITADDILRSSYALIEQTLADQPALWSDAQLRDLAHTIAAHDIDWQRGFTGERAIFRDLIQRLYTDDGTGDGRLVYRSVDERNVFELISIIGGAGGNADAEWYSNDRLALLALPAANMVVASRRETVDTYEQFMLQAIEQLHEPLWEQSSQSFDEEVVAILGEPLGKFRNLFVGLLVPAYDGLRMRIEASAGRRDGVLIGFALEMYRREHGQWPKSLAELAPRWLPSLPVDRINGGPLGYRIVDERPLVYSSGVDSDDDAGRLPKNYAGKPENYRVSAPYEIPAKTTDWVRNEHDGDWVIWSTVAKNATPIGAGDGPAR